MSKLPYFPFYAGDWLSSATVRSMSLSEIGVYTILLAAAWLSDEPGTLPHELRKISKITGIEPRILRRFFAKYPGIFGEFSGRLRNEDLVDLAIKYREISKMRSVAGKMAHRANAQQMLGKSSDPDSDSDSELDASSLLPFSQDQQAVGKQERTAHLLEDAQSQRTEEEPLAPAVAVEADLANGGERTEVQERISTTLLDGTRQFAQSQSITANPRMKSPERREKLIRDLEQSKFGKERGTA